MILVTGANGYIGQHVVKALCDQGQKVRAFVRLGCPPDQEQFLQQCGAEVQPGDLLNQNDLQQAVDGVEFVVHLVGSINKPKNEDFMTLHEGRTRSLIEALKKNRPKKIIFVSTLGASFRSNSQYEISKWEAEEVIRKSTLPYVILRSSLVFGRQTGTRDSKLITRMKETVLKGPFIPVISRLHGRIQPIYIGDLVKLVLESMTHAELQRHTIEVGGPDIVIPSQIMQTIAEVLGVEKKNKVLPFFWVHLAVSILEKFSSSPRMTVEQLNLMRSDNIIRFPNMENYFQIELTPLREGLAYLADSSSKLNKN